MKLFGEANHVKSIVCIIEGINDEMAVIDDSHRFALDDLPRGHEAGGNEVEERIHPYGCKQQHNVGES